jgi:hypothetical protein
MPGIMTLVQRKGKVRQHIKTVLFFAGQPLDGTTVPANVCGPSPEALSCYSVHPLDPIHLEWRKGINRFWVLDEIVEEGFNTLSMSTWGESWLPCYADCSFFFDDKECQKEPRCSKQAPCSMSDLPGCGKMLCRIGWFGRANMQISPAAKDELFDAAVAKPILIIPFIESRFGFDWDFSDEFPYNGDGELAICINQNGINNNANTLCANSIKIPATTAILLSKITMMCGVPVRLKNSASSSGIADFNA